MGLFNHVRFEMDCPKCGTRLKDFQTKDGYPTMDTVNYWECHNFYTWCENCNTWVEFNLKKSSFRPIEDYEMTTRGLYGRKSE